MEHKRAEGRDRDTKKRVRGWGRTVPHPLSGIYRIHMSGVTLYNTDVKVMSHDALNTFSQVPMSSPLWSPARLLFGLCLCSPHPTDHPSSGPLWRCRKDIQEDRVTAGLGRLPRCWK